uniref:Uncharacterized protein n=1 Tax=Anguilla anguilla TaxID=7936 RepID=A0A0E9T9F0_ANGAN
MHLELSSEKIISNNHQTCFYIY